MAGDAVMETGLPRIWIHSDGGNMNYPFFGILTGLHPGQGNQGPKKAWIANPAVEPDLFHAK